MDDRPTNLIVNFLPRDLTDDEFKRMFCSFGNVNSCKIVREAKTGHSYGFGFCDYFTHEDALKAIKTYDGLHLKDKNIKVAFAKDGDKIKEAKLYIEDIPPIISEEDLRSLFEPFGCIINCRFLKDATTGPNKCAFVQYETKDEADEAIDNLNNVKLEEFDGISLKVSHADNKTIHFKTNDKMKFQKSPINGFGAAGRNTMNMFASNMMDGQFAMSRYGMGSSMGAGMGAGMGSGMGSLNGSSNSTLFVYNIGQETQEDAIWKLLAPFGAVVKVDMMFDKDNKQGKGFCFVTMRNYEDCIEAIRKLNGVIHEINPNKPLQVRFKKDDKGSNISNSMDMFDSYAGFTDDPYMNPLAAMRRPLPMASARPLQSMMPMLNPNFDNGGGHILFVYNIGSDANESDMLKIFAQFAAVLKIDVIMNKETKKGKGFCFVTMKNQTDAKRAINALDGARHPSLNSSKPLQVRFKDDDGKNANQGVGDGFFTGVYDPYGDMGGPVPNKNIAPGLMEQQYFGGYDPYSRDIDYGLSGPIRNGRSLAMKNRFNPLSGREIPSMADMTISDGHIIFIYNINPKSDESFLYKLFAPFGAVTKVDIIKNNENGEGKGYGFVTMKHYDEAVDSIKKLNGLCHESNPSKPLQVKFKTSKK